MSVEFFTAQFGIAPLRKMPVGIKSMNIQLPRGHPEDALSALRRMHPDLAKPYWSLKGNRLTVITEEDRAVVGQALWDLDPPEETARETWGGLRG